MQLLEDEITQFTNKYENILLAGDFNSHTGLLVDITQPDLFLSEYLNFDENLIDYFNQSQPLLENNLSLQRNNTDHSVNSLGRKLIDICKNNNLYILNGRFSNDVIGNSTYLNNSVIDYMITTSNLLKFTESFDIKELDRMYSDGHKLLELKLKTAKAIQEPTPTINNNIQRKNHKWQSEKANEFSTNIDQILLTDLTNQLNNVNLHTIEQDDINEITEKISTIFFESSTKAFPNNRPKPNATTPNNQSPNKNNSKDKPWFGRDCRIKRKLYRKAKHNYANNRCVENKNKLDKASKNYKKTINFYISKFRHKNAHKLRSMQKNCPKDYWKYLNSLKQNTNQGETPNLNDFFDFFKRTSRVDGYDQININPNIGNNEETLNSPITENEITEMINKCQNNKASSPADEICNEYLKTTKNTFISLYTKLFNIILDTGIVPDAWTAGYLIPIYKGKGPLNDPSNYRPITILSCLGKLFTSVLNNRLVKFTNKYDTINQNQAGFRKNFSTSDHIFTLYYLTNLFKSQKKKLFVGFIDFSRCFDTIPRAELFSKLINAGVDGKFIRVVRNIYNNIKSCIQLNSQKSSFYTPNCGILQGESLSPLLFSFYLNDLNNYLSNSQNEGVTVNYSDEDSTLYLQILVMLFADDTIILAQSPESFQKSLDDFQDYCTQWKLKINTTKTKVIIFGSNRRSWPNYNFNLGGSNLEIVEKYKYLGIYFTPNGNFKTAITHLSEQANKAMHLLYKRITNLHLPIDLQLKLFDHTIIPILTYSCEVWGFDPNAEILEKTHLAFLRKITKARKSTPAYMLYGELNRYPIKLIIQSRMINYWNRLVVENQNKYSSFAYRAMTFGTTQFKWLECIRTIFNTTGKTYILENQFQTEPKNINIIIKRTLMDQFIQTWNTSLTITNKGRNYSNFKTEFKFENYLIKLPTPQALNLFKLRTCNTRFPIEVGRWTRTPYNERYCHLCNSIDLGDTFHYLFKCNKFSDLRNKYIKRYYRVNPNMLKFTQLMQSENVTTLKNLSTLTINLIKNMTN